MYGFKERAFPPKFYKYSNFDRPGKLQVDEKARPCEARSFTSLAIFTEKFIFVTGGCAVVFRSDDELLTSVEFYNVDSDRWTRTTSLNHGTSWHSSCTQGDMLYCFNTRQPAIESLNAREATQGV